MTAPLWQKAKGTKEPLDESKRGEWKIWLKTQHSKNEDHGIQSHHFMTNRCGNKGNSERLYFLGFQNHCRWWLQPWNQKMLIPWKKTYDQPKQHIKKQRHYFADKSSQTMALSRRTFVGKVTSLFFNMLSRLVIVFLPRSKHLLISWLESPSAVILVPPRIFSHCFHCFPIHFPWSDGTRYHDLSFLNVEF